MSWHYGYRGKGGYGYWQHHGHFREGGQWWPHHHWCYDGWEWSGIWKGGAKGKSGKSSKGWKAWKNQFDLDGYSKDGLVAQANLGWGVSGACFRGTFETGGITIPVAIKPATNWCEDEVLHRIYMANPPLQCVVPVVLVKHPTSAGDVNVMALGSLGSLNDVLKSVGSLANGTFLSILANISEGLEALHSENIIHCDLKPDNVVLNVTESGDVSVWLIDFGDARICDNPDTWFSQGPGAPEIQCVPDNRRAQYSTKTDSWCLAQCAACLWSGGQHGVGNPAWLYQDMPLYDELQQCLSDDPSARLDASSVARAAHAGLQDLNTDAKSELAALVASLGRLRNS